MARTRASRVSTLIEKPATNITKHEPTSATGITSRGMSVVRQSRRNRKITSITSTKATMMVCRTSATDLRMKRLASNAQATSTSEGMVCSMVATRRRTSSAMVMVLAPGWGRTTTSTMGMPLRLSTVRSLRGPSSARPTSRSRMTRSASLLRIRSLKASGVSRRLMVRTGSSTSRPSIRPDGSSTFSRSTASRTSSGDSR